MPTLRKHLSAPALYQHTKRQFSQIPDAHSGMSLPNILMSGLAIFSLKYPSLLQFDKDRLEDATLLHNMTKLYGVDQIPCDTYLRQRLDEVSPDLLQPVFRQLFAQVQRGKVLEPFTYLDDHYLLSVDGTGFFSSHEVHCEQCCVKNHRNGKVTYYHQMLGAALVHPIIKPVIPFAPEAILKQDGKKKNDCERNASQRLLTRIRKEHPHLKVVILEDGLASNAPHIRLLRSLSMSFILGAKPRDHVFLFDWVKTNPQTKEWDTTDEAGFRHQFRYLNNAPLNDSNYDCEVNFLEYWETNPKGKVLHMSWVTDRKITEKNLMSLMRAGRARWRIENETFNTLKNQGYHFEHNFGHGKQHLSTVFAYLMMLAFLIDQIQALSCQLFQEAQKYCGRPSYFWEKLRSMFLYFEIDSWELFYQALSRKHHVKLVLDTS